MPSLLEAVRSYLHLYWDCCDHETEHVAKDFHLLASLAGCQAGLVSGRREYEQLGLEYRE